MKKYRIEVVKTESICIDVRAENKELAESKAWSLLLSNKVDFTGGTMNHEVYDIQEIEKIQKILFKGGFPSRK